MQKIGNVYTNLFDEVSKQNINLEEVSTYYDGTPMTDVKVDGRLYMKNISDNKYYRQVLPNWGENFLNVDTMADLRALDDYNLLLVKAGYYKGVTLLGYYEKGEYSLNYLWNNTQGVDDGGSVINVGGGSFEADFEKEVYCEYFGIHNKEIAIEKATLKALELGKISKLKTNINVSNPIKIYSDIFSESNTITSSNNIIFIIQNKSVNNICGFRFEGNILSSQSNAPSAIRLRDDIDGIDYINIKDNYFLNSRVVFNNRDLGKNMTKINISNNIFKCDFTNLPKGDIQNDIITFWGVEFLIIKDNKFNVIGANRIFKMQVNPSNYLFNTKKIIVQNNDINFIGTRSETLGNSKQIFDLYNNTQDFIFSNNFVYSRNTSVVIEDKTTEVLKIDRTHNILNNVFNTDHDVIGIRSSDGKDIKLDSDGKTFVNINNNVFIKEGFNEYDRGLVEVAFVYNFNFKGNSLLSKVVNPTNPSSKYGVVSRNNILNKIQHNLFKELYYNYTQVDSFLEENYSLNTKTINLNNNNFEMSSAQQYSIQIQSTALNSNIDVINIDGCCGYSTDTLYRFIGLINLKLKLLTITNNYTNLSSGLIKNTTTYNKATIFGNSWIQTDEIILPNSTTQKGGFVKQSTAIANVTSAPPTQITTQTITTIEEAQTAINNLVTMVNSLQTNNAELTTKLNAKLNADRASGQQAT